MPRLPKIPQDLERAARRAPLFGRLVPAPRGRARRPVPAAPPPPGSDVPDLLSALDGARDRLRSAIPPRAEDE